MSSADAKLAELYPNLSESERKVFSAKRAELFKSTIAVCVLYGAVALAFLLLAAFSSRAREVFTQQWMPFVVTFVGGVVFVVILLVVQITGFKPRVLTGSVYDKNMCPDYWKLQRTPDDFFNGAAQAATSVDKGLAKFQCVPDPNVFGTGTLTLNKGDGTGTSMDFWSSDAPVNSSAAPTSAEKKLSEYAGRMFNDVNTINCKEIFPELLAKEDQLHFPNNPNAMRCTYAEKCGIPWSAVCPK